MRLLYPILLALLLLVSCNQNSPKQNSSRDINFQRDIIRKHSISQITEIEVGLDTIGNPRWKRPLNILFYYRSGLVSKALHPSYLSDETYSNSILSKRAKHEGMTLKELRNSAIMGQSNIPTGYVDTTLYEYDSNENLTSQRDDIGTIIYKYDRHNNRVERCFRGKLSETTCSYSTYKYDKNNRIVSKLDSLGPISNIRGIKASIPNKETFYEYGDKGRVIFDGEVRMIFNDVGQVTEEFWSTFNTRILFFYDKDGYKIKESITDDVQGNIHKYFYYNEVGLLKEIKVLDNNNQLIELKNFEYKFF